MIYYRNSESIIQPIDDRRDLIRYTVNYPVIVCNNFKNLYRVDIDSNLDPVNITDNFHLEVNYAYMTSGNSNMNEYFLIDILDYHSFDTFLKKIERDTELVNFFLN